MLNRMLNISIIGTGYVGLVSGVCFAELGFNVICIDTDAEKIAKLNRGEIPIYEPGLNEMAARNTVAGRLRFSNLYSEAVGDADVIFIAVGTPSDENGSADLRYVIQAAASIAEHMNRYAVIVDKSTVPVGTGQLVRETVRAALSQRGMDTDFDVVSNPEFLREGSAVHDFMCPDRVIIGAETEKARAFMHVVYHALELRNHPIIDCDIETAELIKYAANAYLATRITFINELALLCEEVGADVSKVSAAMGADVRIGPKYLNAGPGYGGSCFPKDTRALVSLARDYGVGLSVVEAVIRANDNQRRHMVKRITDALNGLKGRKIGVLGLAFKPETDDVRESPATAIVKDLIFRGASLTVYDPIAMDNAKKTALDGLPVRYADGPLDAAANADALIVATEWDEFRTLDMTAVRRAMAGSYLFDLRNIYQRDDMARIGFIYYGVGMPGSKPNKEYTHSDGQ